MTTEKRPLYLLIYPANSRSRLSPAHWSLFIPSLASLQESQNPKDSNDDNDYTDNSNNNSEKNTKDKNKAQDFGSDSGSGFGSSHSSHSFPKRGKVIHAIGSPFTGFTLVVWRNHDITADDRFKTVMLAPVKLCDLDMDTDTKININDDDIDNNNNNSNNNNEDEGGDEREIGTLKSKDGNAHVARRKKSETDTSSLIAKRDDTLEREAQKIPAPGVSKNPLGPDYENCQSWAWAYVRHLIKRGIIRDGEAVLDVLGRARTT